MKIEFYTQLFIAVYIVLLGLMVIIFKKKKSNNTVFSKTSEFYLSSSKPLKLPVLILTFAATLFSAFFMVGVPGFLYTHGLLTWPFAIFGGVFGMIGLYHVGKKILQVRKKFGDHISPLELFLKTPLSKLIFIVSTSIFILPYLAIQISGFGKLVESATQGNIPFIIASGSGLLIIFIYSLLLGIKGIAISDFFQGTLLLISAAVLGYFMTYIEFNGPRDLIDTVYKYNPNLFTIKGAKGIFTLGAVISGGLLFASVPVTQPQFLTRYLLIKDEKGLQYLKNIAIGMGLLLVIGTFSILPVGLGGAAIFPSLESGDLLVGHFLNESLPAWFGGIFTVGVLAAAMSTADSILFSLGQMFSRDIYRGIFNKKATEKAELLAGKSFIFLIATIAFLFGISSSNLIVNLSSLSYAGTLQLLPTVIAGLWFPNSWKHASTISILSGTICLFVFLKINPLNSYGIHPGISALIIGTLAYVLSHFIAKKRPIK